MAVFIVEQYKLRSSGLSIDSGRSILQTFGIDEYQVTVWEAINYIPVSSQDFAGYKIGGKYSSASFQRLPYLSGGGQVFSGQAVSVPHFIDDDVI